jgi:hypothetical protein
MSVENARYAAAQRTAEASRRVRVFRVATWILIVPLLSLFSFSVVAGARGLNGKRDYDEAVRELGPRKGGAYVVLRERPNLNPLERIFSGGAADHVCWIDSSQLARIAERWPTGRMSIEYGRGSLELVTVSGAKEPELRAELGGVKCVLVQLQRTFYLPFDAHGS